MNPATTTPSAAPAAATTTADQNAPNFADIPVVIEMPYETPPEKIAADLAELEAIRLSQVPKGPEWYPDSDDLQAIPPAERKEWKTIAHSERWAPAELHQFARAVKGAAVGYKGKPLADCKTLAHLTERQIESAIAEGNFLKGKYRAVRELLDTKAGEDYFVVLLLSQLHERRARRGK